MSAKDEKSEKILAAAMAAELKRERLRDAAPDMLAALKELAHWRVGSKNSQAIARAAIAKAEGQS